MQTKKEWFEYLLNVPDKQVNVERADTVGSKIKVAEEYLEKGYPEHLKSKLEFVDEDENPVKFPNTNLIIVATK